MSPDPRVRGVRCKPHGVVHQVHAIFSLESLRAVLVKSLVMRARNASAAQIHYKLVARFYSHP